mgnify:CR=1 FL=1
MTETDPLEKETDTRPELDCPSCGNSITIRDYQQNKVVCENCGRVLKEEIKDHGPEWRAFDQKQREEKSRAGPPSTETIHDKGLSTQIDWKNRDGKGKSLSAERRSKFHRMRKWHKRVRISDSKDRNLSYALSEIKRMSSQLGIPRNVQEIASKIYREAVEADLIRGRSMDGCASATLSITSRLRMDPSPCGLRSL